ncbi:MAG: ABC transporter ATP-binding protein [Patescibacteria group bacterium]|nr:ABC transporter ATP-binding protein [Patescibacteria group bacterium]MCL5431598.1 ABC transporter ATP-binding protein [Patescibacteria group bacterium]
MNNNIVISVNHASKKFCRNLRHGLVYGLADLGKQALGRDAKRGILRKDEFWAVDDVSFNVKRGETFGIIGDNGSGKSTLLRLLNGIFIPDKGSIAIQGRVGALIAVGAGFHPQMTGRENIYLNGAILGMTRDEIKQKFDSIVNFADIGKFLDAPVSTYSSGMYVRLGFAIAIHCEPDVILVDEILSVGDVKFQKKCVDKITQMRESGSTFVIVSHSPNAIKRLCSRCLLLSRGQAKALGETSQVVSHYLGTDVVERSVVNLLKLKNNYGMGEISPRSIKLLNNVRDKFASYWNEPIKFMLTGTIKKEMANISFGIGLTTSDDTPMFTTRSLPVKILPKGEHSILVEIRHNLSPGLYNVALGANSGDNIYYFHAKIAQLEIRDNPNNPYPLEDTGLIHCSSNWKL